MNDPRLRVDGVPVRVRGYAVLYDRVSEPLDDGLREVVKPGAFTTALHNIGKNSIGLHLRWTHDGPPGGIISVNVRLWDDGLGIAFESDDDLRPTAINVAALQGVVAGSRAVSWEAVFKRRTIESVGGEKMHVVHDVQHLAHIALVATPAYPQTGCWLNSEDPHALPGHLRNLALSWPANQP